MNPLLILIGSCFLICLLPLSLYLLYLSQLNSRVHPTLVPGVWDFVYLLVGLSGFLLIGGPVVIGLVDSSWRAYWFQGGFARMQAAWRPDGFVWSSIAIAYLFMFTGILMMIIRSRERYTLIYNMPLARLEPLILEILGQLQLPWRKCIGGIEIGDPSQTDGASSEAKVFLEPIFLQIEMHRSSNHAHLFWLDEDPLVRKEIEQQIEKRFSEIVAPANPIAGWLLTLSTMLMCFLFLWMLYLIYVLFFS